MIRSTPGRLLERPDVAALAADDPALHLVGRQVDDGDRVLGGVVGGHALHRGEDDVAGLVLGLLARGPLDRPGELDRVVLGLLADGLEEDRLASSADMPETRSRAATCSCVRPGEVLAGLVELALAVEELAIALLEHVAALVELFVALEEAAFEAGELGPAWPGPRPRPRAASRSFSSLASRMSSFWRARASASMRRASAWAAFIVCDAHRLRASTPSTAPPAAATRATATTTGVSICRPPIRPIRAAGRSTCRRWHRVRGEDSWIAPGDALPSVGRDRRRFGCWSAARAARFIWRVAYGARRPGGSTEPRTEAPRPCGRCDRHAGATDGVAVGEIAGDRSRPSVIGPARPGLMMSWHLQRAGRDARRPRPARDARRRLARTAGTAFRLGPRTGRPACPGFPYDGSRADGFMTPRRGRGRMRRYADAIEAPVRRGTDRASG